MRTGSTVTREPKDSLSSGRIRASFISADGMKKNKFHTGRNQLVNIIYSAEQQLTVNRTEMAKFPVRSRSFLSFSFFR